MTLRQYPDLHAMAMAALNGHGDPDVQELLPATVSPDRVALAGLHAWTEDDFPKVAGWGIASFSPGDLRETTRPLLDWLAATGCSRVAIHSTSTPSTAPGVRTPGTSALFTASGKPVG